MLDFSGHFSGLWSEEHPELHPQSCQYELSAGLFSLLAITQFSLLFAKLPRALEGIWQQQTRCLCMRLMITLNHQTSPFFPETTSCCLLLKNPEILLHFSSLDRRHRTPPLCLHVHLCVCVYVCFLTGRRGTEISPRMLHMSELPIIHR